MCTDKDIEIGRPRFFYATETDSQDLLLDAELQGDIENLVATRTKLMLYLPLADNMLGIRNRKDPKEPAYKDLRLKAEAFLKAKALEDEEKKKQAETSEAAAAVAGA